MCQGIRRVLLSGLAILLVLVLVELGFRWFLFSPYSAGTGHRQPSLYADYYSDDLYWQLQHEWHQPNVPFTTHSELGWVGYFDPVTLRHYQEGKTNGRRPVLFFGDSFMACADGVPCFETILAQDAQFDERFYGLNYGVGGYGLDQILLLMERVLPLYPNAIVILGVMTLDIDRAQLCFREAVKPKFDVVDGTLILRQRRCSEKPEPISYLYQKVIHSTLLPRVLQDCFRNTKSMESLKIERAEHLLRRIDTILGDRRVIRVLFDPLRSDVAPWRRELLEGYWRGHEQPFISTWEHYQQQGGPSMKSLLVRDDGHPTLEMNQWVADQIWQALSSNP